MSLLVDYSKRRAEIGSPEDSHTSFSWNSEVEEGHESFACDYGEVDAKQNESWRTDSTASLESSESSSSCYDEISSQVTTSTAPVSFRIKRRSMSHMGGDASALPAGPGDASSSSARFHESLPSDWKITTSTTNTAPVIKVPVSTELNMKIVSSARPAPYRRQATAPARVNSGDSLQCRLQYAAWKKKQQNLLSASAVIATSSDRDLYQHQRRRRSSSMAQLVEDNQDDEQEEHGAAAASSPMRSSSTTKPKLPSRFGSHHDLGYALQERSNSSYNTTRRRRVTMSHINDPSSSSSEAVPAAQHVPSDDLGYGQQPSNRNSSSRSSGSRRRRVTMSHVNNPPPSSDTTIPVPDQGYVQQQELSNSRCTRSRRRVTMSHSSSELVPPALVGGRQPLSNDSTSDLGYGESQPQTTSTRSNRRRVTMSHVTSTESSCIPGPPALEPRRTCEMNALQALCGRRAGGGGSFHSTLQRQHQQQRRPYGGPDAIVTPPNKYSQRRRVTMSHVNVTSINPPSLTASTAGAEPIRISEITIRNNNNSDHKQQQQQQQQRHRRAGLLSQSLHGGGSGGSLSSSSLSLSRSRSASIIGGAPSSSLGSYRRQGTPPEGLPRSSLRRNTTTTSSRGGGGGGRPSLLADAGKSQSFSLRSSAARRTSSMNMSLGGYRRQGTPPQETISSYGNGRRSLLSSSSSFHGVRRRDSNNTGRVSLRRDSSDNNNNNNSMTSSQQHQQQLPPSPPRRSTSRRLSMAASTSAHNLNDFVTGSRIRRLT